MEIAQDAPTMEPGEHPRELTYNLGVDKRNALKGVAANYVAGEPIAKRMPCYRDKHGWHTADVDGKPLELRFLGSGWGRAEFKFTKGFDVKMLGAYLAETA